MSPTERQQMIDAYAQGFSEVTRALDGFPAERLSDHPIPGKWSARQIVHHLADSESISAQRLRKLLVEHHALITGYDQEEYARRLHYEDRKDLAPALEAFRAARENTLPLLQAMTDEDWTREGWHTESGRYTAETWLAIYATHAHGHAAQIRRLREAVGA